MSGAPGTPDGLPARPPALSSGGMVSSSHPAVSQAGADVLSSGGNAVDAALAMAAMSWLVLPGQCGVGGDAFAVVREPGGEVWTVAGSGFGPDGGVPDFYRAQGMSRIPGEGPLSVAVPGELAALEALHARAATRSLQELWAPAVVSARRGVPCSAKTRADIAEHAGALGRDPDAAQVLLPGGRLPRVGERLVYADLAATIELLAKEPMQLYDGRLAELAVGALASAGAPFSGEEWAACGRVVAQPSITGRYGGLVVHQTPLPTPGWMVLQQAAICDGVLAGAEWLGADAVHWMASAARIAFGDRVQSCGGDGDTWLRLLEAGEVEERRRAIREGAAAAPAPAYLDGDTTSMVAVDEEGRAVSFIHSLAFTFGARVSIPGTGVVLNNRLGRGAYLTPGHPNEVRPRRRPLHTLNAWIVTDENGGLRHVGNTPGGDGQVQWNMQLLSHLIDHGADPAAAVSAPRFTVFPGSDADVLGDPQELRVESRLGAGVVDALRQRGHPVRVVGAWGAGGSAQVVSVDGELGVLSGAADPRQEGVTLGV